MYSAGGYILPDEILPEEQKCWADRRVRWQELHEITDPLTGERRQVSVDSTGICNRAATTPIGLCVDHYLEITGRDVPSGGRGEDEDV